jgi:two-component system, chemotaxis family, CheB/CheR fusion protein
MRSDAMRFPIVGIGASAGGIPALEEFFRGLPDDCGMGFVIITHLSPDRESVLHEVVARYTDMPVLVAEDGALVNPNSVYVMPHNAILTIEGGVLKLRRPDPVNRERKPVDIFLSALAEDQGEYAVGIILSGGDGDGTLGIKAIKERGGLTLAQAADGSGPRNPDMPQSAISSGMVDIAASAEQMGQKLVEFTRGFDVLDDEQLEASQEAARTEIYGILRTQSGHDFSGYKTKTFLRRVKRRMQLAQLQTISDYIALLKRQPSEVTDLFRDLLINVTNFFRDADAFEALENIVIPRLFEGKGAGDTVRVWVPGCATGEEVFSIAILAREHMDRLTAAPRVQIFATDIDEPALAVARSARYPEGLLEGLSAERKERFFKVEGASYVLSGKARELCIFSPHSVIRDPPFSRMDMVSCRNLLIYFGPDIQRQVIPTFHYALKPGGYLFLGTSESIGQHGDLFTVVEKKQRIFQAREHPSSIPRLPILFGSNRSGIFPEAAKSGSRAIASYPLRQAVETQVLERFSPAHVVINGDGDVVYYSAGTGKFLEASQGAPSRQLLSLARRGLRLDLRSALREAITMQKTVSRQHVAIEGEDDRIQYINLTVEPLAERGPSEPLYLVLFAEIGPPHVRSETDDGAIKNDSMADLERDLRDTRERLQSTIEEYETALEELKSSNEELVSVNEEAQSSNEELEASKEEAQSLNEELNTINAELNAKIEDLDRANNDLKNLFESTQIATVFLDRNLVIRTFTPAASSFFNLRPSDVGRPLTELSSQLHYPELRDHIDAVFNSGNAIVHHLATDTRGKQYLTRLIPYRNDGRKTEGVVVTMVDVTQLAEAEQHQKLLISELNHRVKNMLAVVVSIAGQTLRSAASPEAFNEAFIGRLHAMSRAYALLSREQWTEAALTELLTQELNPFGEDRYTLIGPEVSLKPQQGISVAMAIHELATNAAKYGAFSSPDGRVDIQWSVADQILTLDWSENGGPPVSQPESDGFGFDLLKGEIAYRHRGSFKADFDPSGLKVHMSMTLKTDKD